MSSRCVAILLLVVSTLWWANYAEATNFWKNSVIAGNWSAGNNWSAISAAGLDNAGAPTSGEGVNVVFTDGAARTVFYDVAAPSIGALSIDLTGPGTTVSTLSLPGTINLTTNGIVVGGYNGGATTNGRGAFTQSSGIVTTNPVVGDLILGYGAASSGVYTLSGGAFVNNLDEYIGFSGAGTFNHSGGSNTVNASAAGFLSLGTNAGSTGTYNLSGTGILSVATPEYIGYAGSGTFIQSAGSHTISGGKSLYLGYQTGSSGSYTLSNAGTLAVSGPQFVGYDGTGTFTQSGGSNGTGVQNLNVGYNAGSTGTYTLSGGTLTPGFQSIVGLNGNGVFVQTGGIHTVNLGFLAIAHGVNSVSSYALSGGAVTSASGTSVGIGGAGTFNQSGGTHTANGGLYLGSGMGSSGAYALSAGSLIVNGVSSIGANNFGAGTFNHTGGTHTVSSILRVGEGVGASGMYNLSGTGVLSSTNDQFIGDSGTGTFNQSGGTNTINNGTFVVGRNATSTGTYNLSGTGALLSYADQYIGNSATGNITQSGGTFNQTGGTNTLVNRDLIVGANLGSTGSYNLSAGALSSADQSIGLYGTGAFNQSGGTNTITNKLSVGDLYGGIGTYTLSAGALSSGGSQTIGADDGTGTFNQSGGTNTINAGSFVVGKSATSMGTYNLSGTGALLTYFDQYIGNSATGNPSQSGGTFNQSGGTNTLVNRDLIVGANLGSTGSYNLSAGALSSADQSIGLYGTGAFNQSGGTNTTGRISVGDGVYSTGIYTLSGGSLVSSGFEYVGNEGAGVLIQTGGVNSVTSSSLILGSSPGSTGTYALSGGVANVAFSVYVGGTSEPRGAGVLNVSGAGVLTLGGTLVASNTPGTAINLSGGTIHAAALNFNGAASQFHWTGGTLDLTSNVTWDSAAAQITTSNAFGPSLTVGLNQTLTVTGNETLGGAGVFGLNLNNGSAHQVTGTLTISPAGTISQNAGSTLYAATIIQAGGTVNGTLQNQTNFIYQSGLFNGRLLNLGTASVAGSSFATANGVENDGLMTINAGQTLTINGAGLDNLGTFMLAGGTVSGAGAALNNYGGTLQGRGTINSTFTNNGVVEVDGVLRFNGAIATNNGIIRGSGTVIGAFANAAGGSVDLADDDLLAISNAWTNSGQVALAGGGATLGGGAIANSGTIHGAGAVNAPIANAGVIRASGGELDLGAAGVTNAAAGLIQATTGNTVMVLQGLAANAGTIALTGGAFDNDNHPLANSGIINGYGVIRTSLLTNSNKLNVGEGNMDVFGPVTNNGTIGVQGGRSIYFFGAVNGAGSYTGIGTAVFLAAVAPGNSPAAVSFGGNATLASSSTLLIELGGTTRGSQYDAILAGGNLALGGALAVTLIDAGAGLFAPHAGDTFDILDWGSLSGAFASISLPTLTGLQWDSSRLYTDGVLAVVSPYLAADFNENGAVNAVDFTLWQGGFGTSADATHLQGDANGDHKVDGADFLTWQQQLGSSSPVPPATVVPEPATFVVAAIALAALAPRVVQRFRSFSKSGA